MMDSYLAVAFTGLKLLFRFLIFLRMSCYEVYLGTIMFRTILVIYSFGFLHL